MTTPKLKSTDPKAATPKAQAAPKATPAKAPVARKAPAKATSKGTDCRCEVLAENMRGLNTRIEALEAGQAINEARIAEAFENMTKVIANLQLTLATIAQAAPASRETSPKAQAKASTPKAEAAPKARSESYGTYTGPSVEGPIAPVLEHLAERVIANYEAGFLNENVAKASPDSMRRYLRTAENKALKAARATHDLTLGQIDEMFNGLFA